MTNDARRAPDPDPAVQAAKISRTAQIVTALIAAVGAAAAAGIPAYFAGRDQGIDQGNANAAVAPTATVTATVTVTAAAPPAGQTATPEAAPAPSGGLHLTDLAATGEPLIKGARNLSGRRYERSLAYRVECDGNDLRTTIFSLPSPYRKFSAVVGVEESKDKSDVVSFEVYVDADEDGKADDAEQIATVAAQSGRPAEINADLGGATRLILGVKPDPCMYATLVWGDPRVS